MGRLSRHFFKENVQVANKSLKRCSASVIIMEMQSKTTMAYHFTLTSMDIIKIKLKLQVMKMCKNLCIAGGNVRWCSHCRKQYSDSLKKLKLNYNMIQQFHFWV